MVRFLEEKVTYSFTVLVYTRNTKSESPITSALVAVGPIYYITGEVSIKARQ